MATELLSPLLPQRRRGLSVAAAAPLLLLLAVVTFSCSPVAPRAPELVELTLLAGAREKGAGIRSPPSLFNRRYARRSWSLTDLYRVVRCSVLGWEPARLPSAERLRLRCPQLARLSSGVTPFFSLPVKTPSFSRIRHASTKDC